MKALAITLNQDTIKKLELALTDIKFDIYSTTDEFAEKYDSLADGTYHVILVGTQTNDDFIYEAGQVCRNQCPRTKIFSIIENKEQFYPKKILKNGYNDVFLLPPDFDRLKNSVLEAGTEEIKSRIYKKIKSFDIVAESTLDFDTYIYLPLNKKHIKYSKSKKTIEAKKVEKLQQHQVANLFIKASEAETFYQYVAAEINKTSRDANFMSATEREDKIIQMTRGIFTEVFDKETQSSFESGREVLSMCQKVISSIISNGKDTNWFNRLAMSLSGMSDDYTHASETSTFASLFALIIGNVKVDDVAIAGYLHDLGMSDVINYDPNLPIEKQSELTQKQYFSHVERTIEYIKNKKMIISDAATKAILQHHERFDGKGFPKAITGERVSTEAQLVSYADQLQYLMTLSPGKSKLSPKQALETIAKNGSISPEISRKIIKALS